MCSCRPGTTLAAHVAHRRWLKVFGEYLLVALISIIASTDRVAFAQFMISRPVVVAPLSAAVFGEPMVGLQVGLLLELLWLGRLPVGAVIPPDDTQIALGATVTALTLDRLCGFQGMPIVLLAVLTAIPLGKCGQIFERMARAANDRLNLQVQSQITVGDLRTVERLHMRGGLHFMLAGLATALVIVVASSTLLWLIAPLLLGMVRETGFALQYSLVLIGAAALLGTTNVNRGTTLFGASFAGTLLAMWLR
ncbi:MAG: hypothetical protein C0614_09575 [Desulfuromonas sp.]|nr:MAG: hypothetical protein C0614_09575 [Desulfuromonas sp.]